MLSLKEMNTGDRLIFWGNLLESLARTLISVGEILREKDLPANAEVFDNGDMASVDGELKSAHYYDGDSSM